MSTDTTCIGAMSDPTDRAGGLSRRPWVILGCGRLGRLLGLLAGRLDIPVRATWNRSRAAARESDELLHPERALWGELPEVSGSVDLDGAVVWLTVVDDAIEAMAGEVGPDIPAGSLFLHGCGSLDASVLRVDGLGASVGSLHPLLAITDPERAAERAGEVVWTVEGEAPAVDFGRALTGALGAECIELQEGTRALYHASAATAANLVVALVDAAVEMAEQTGLSRRQARDMLLPLVASSVDNLRESSTSQALSGPAARGDEGTIRRHREALAEESPELLELYDVLTARARTLVDGDE